MSQRRINIITVGVILSLILASLESTVVATAMPSIVSQLGGLSIYSWVFSIYMLTSTTTVPIYGKVSDILGRKKVYAFAMALFLVGSVLCGFAQTMESLIVFRAVQGIGAGGILPMALTTMGELFALEKRARMQGLVSCVWGLSSIFGPFVGGILVDRFSWEWVFFINLLPGLLAIIFVWFAWVEEGQLKGKKAQLDIPGTIFLIIGVLFFLLGLNALDNPANLWFIFAALVILGLFIMIERKAADPIIPLKLFTNRLFLVAFLQGILAGAAMFGGIAYIPLFVQAVVGTTATIAGLSLTPMSVIWAISSFIGGRLLIRINFRLMAISGMTLMVIGSYFLTTIGVHSKQLNVILYTSLMGIGMGLTFPIFTVLVQTSVAKKMLGSATSTLQFGRNIGGTLGVSVLGVYLSSRLAKLLTESGYELGSISLSALINRAPGMETTFSEPLRIALGISVANMYMITFIACIAGLLVVLFIPHGVISKFVHRSEEEKKIS